MFRRFVLDFSSLWGEEAARFAFIYLGWVGRVVRASSNAPTSASTSLLHVAAPSAWHGCLYLFCELCTLVFAGFALYWSLETIATQLQFDALAPALRISQVWFEAAVPLGFAMMAVRVLQSALRDIQDIRAGARRLRRHAAVRLSRDRASMHVTLGLAFILLLLFLAVPFWVALGLGTVALLLTTGAMPLSLLGEALFQGVDSFALIAIPLFVLTGDVMVRSGLAYKLLDFAEATTGSLRSGFGTSTVLGCGFFACISGSDAADAAAIGRITMARLVERGYPKAYACALVASAAPAPAC